MKFKIQISFTSILLVTIFLPDCAIADIYVDLSQSDEVNISNTEQQSSYTFKVDEAESPDQSTISTMRYQYKKKINPNLLPYHHEVMLAAQATSIEPALIHAVITVESNHNRLALSNKGAIGLMQLMPATANRFNVIDKQNPQQNILAGSKYLRELLTLFNGDLKLSIAAYNAGPAAVKKYQNQIPPYKETLQYVPKVLKYYQQYS